MSRTVIVLHKHGGERFIVSGFVRSCVLMYRGRWRATSERVKRDKRTWKAGQSPD